MADQSDAVPDVAGARATPAAAPSELLMALYMGDHERANTLATGAALTLPELAALGDLLHVADHLAQHADDLHDLSGDGWTALHLASFFGFANIVVALIRAGASHTAQSRNEQGNTPLHAALAGKCDRTVVCALLAADADASAIDAQGYAPLHLAASRGNRELSELLIVCGAWKDIQTPDGKRAADIARDRGHAELADWLMLA